MLTAILSGPLTRNCSEWRAKIPSDSINAEHEAGRSPHTAQLIYLPSAQDYHHPKVQQIFGKADVIVFQRNVLTPDVWASLSYWRALGKTVTIDIDDGYSLLPPSNPAHPFWIQNAAGLPSGDPVADLCHAMTLVDALVAPSKVLLKDYEHLVPGFHIPNYPRKAWYAPCVPKPLGQPDIEFGYNQQEIDGVQQVVFTGRERPDSKDWIVFGWGGSISHVDSWVYSGAVEALARIMTEYPQVRLKFCGHEQRIDWLLAKLPEGRIIRQQGVKPEHWPYVVSSFDVGLAPLDMRPVPSNTIEGQPKWEGGQYSYDERRSWLKGVEYLCAGVPWLATRSETYIDLKRHGVLVENGEENWYAAMRGMVENIGSRKRLAAEKKAWCIKKFSMEANVQTYVDVYERIGNLKRTRGGATLPNIFWNKVKYEQPIDTTPMAENT